MELKRKDLIYPDLCYRIIGILFDVYNELGIGYQEKYYQRAIASAFNNNKIKQVFAYLRATNLKLGILANFTNSGIKFKRILNIKDS